MIREAKNGDIKTIVALGMEFAKTPVYAPSIGEKADRYSAAKTAKHLVKQGSVWVSEKNGEITGCIAGTLIVHNWTGKLAATEIFWYWRPGNSFDGIRLFKRFEKWAEEMGATQVHTMTPHEKVGRIYTLLGYSPRERFYFKALGGGS